MIRHSATALVALLAAACSSAPAALENTRWMATEVGGAPIVEGARAWIEFAEDGKIAGHGGCNRYSGTAQFDRTALKFGPVASTRRACANPAAMEQENHLFTAFEATRSYRMEGQDVVLLDGAGKAQARFKPFQGG